jgi:hypothetical protein
VFAATELFASEGEYCGKFLNVRAIRALADSFSESPRQNFHAQLCAIQIEIASRAELRFLDAASELLYGDYERYRSVGVTFTEQVVIRMIRPSDKNLYRYDSSFDGPEWNECEPKPFLSVRAFYNRFPWE